MSSCKKKWIKKNKAHDGESGMNGKIFLILHDFQYLNDSQQQIPRIIDYNKNQFSAVAMIFHFFCLNSNNWY